MPWKPVPDVVGKRFGAWLVVSLAECRKGARRHYYWLCRCECGAELVRATSNLKSSVNACRHGPSILAEKHRVEVEQRVSARADAAIRRDEADRQRVARRTLQAKQVAIRKSSPGAASSWSEMIRRCTVPTARDYPNYGGRGITVCERWRDFAAFLADMGARPEHRTIDRIDNDRGYSCGKCEDCIVRGEQANCRWATATEQNRNSRRTVLTVDLAQEVLGRIEHGESLASVARRMGVSHAVVYAVAARRSWRELAPLAV